MKYQANDDEIWDEVVKFEERHKVLGRLGDEFQANGGCAHDLDPEALIGLLIEWELIRTQEMSDDLARITTVERLEAAGRTVPPPR